MLLGTVEVLTDDDAKRMIWQDGDEQYYPLQAIACEQPLRRIQNPIPE